MVRSLLSLAVFLAAALILPTDALAGYDPKVCKERLAKQGLTACPLKSGNCHEASESPIIHKFCSNRNVYTPISMSVLVNPSNGEKKMFSSLENMLHFLREHPDFNVETCYCCC